MASPPLVELVEVITADGPPPLVEMVEVITVDGPYLLWWKWWKSLQQIAPTPSGRNVGNHYSRWPPPPLVEMVEVITAHGPHPVSTKGVCSQL